MSSLTIQSLNHHFDRRPVLQDISFTAAAGELLCLVGPSGCGKSTTLRLIAGLETVQAGAIRIGEETIASASDGIHTPPAQRRIGMVFQHPSLFPHLTVAGNIAFGIRHHPRGERDAIVSRLLESIGLSDLADHYPHMLSGGQHQRVALARSLAPKPRIMLLDEPFANLDYTLRRELGEDMLMLLKEAGVAVIMISHDPEETLMLADRMVLMRANGSIHQEGTPDDIHNAPDDLEAARFFGPLTIVRGTIGDGRIHTPLGSLPVTAYATPGLCAGDGACRVATRPEGIRILRDGDGHTPGADAPGALVTITRFRHTGAGWLVTAEHASGLTVRFHHIYGAHPRMGEVVRVGFVPPHVFVFPAGNTPEACTG